MDTQIQHEGNEPDVHAEGGTIDGEVIFYRNQAVLNTNNRLELPSDNGTYVFKKDPKDSIDEDIENIRSFFVGPIFHLPDDAGGSDKQMGRLIEENDIVLIVTLISEDGTDHYMHYLLDNVV